MLLPQNAGAWWHFDQVYKCAGIFNKTLFVHLEIIIFNGFEEDIAIFIANMQNSTKNCIFSKFDVKEC